MPTRLQLAAHTDAGLQRPINEDSFLVVDLETGFRGFVITKHEKYLYPYRTAQDHIQAVGLSLDDLIHEAHDYGVSTFIPSFDSSAQRVAYAP